MSLFFEWNSEKFLFFFIQAPSEKLAEAGHILRTVLLTRAPHMIRDRKYHLRTYRRCMVGTEMVDWLIQQSPLVHSRNQAVGMWQALLEEGVIVHGELTVPKMILTQRAIRLWWLVYLSWWCHDIMEMFSVLLALCEGNHPVDC